MDGLSVKNVRLERKIGSGSFATVYKATDLVSYHMNVIPWLSEPKIALL